MDARQKRYRLKNPDKVKAWKRAYYRRHRERIRAERAEKAEALAAYMREYRQRPEVKEKLTVNNKAWREAHPFYSTAYRNAHLEEAREQEAAHRKAHPEVHNEKRHRRRAREQNAERVEPIDRERLIIRDRDICHICGLKIRKGERSIDHLIPIAQGGNHTEDNVALAHIRCNKRRGAGRLPAQLRLFG